MLDGSYFIECDCGSDEHTLRFTIDLDDQSIYLSIFLNQYRPWYQRIWVAVKYIFGYKCRYGHWDVTSLSSKQIDQLTELIETYKKLNEDHKHI